MKARSLPRDSLSAIFVVFVVTAFVKFSIEAYDQTCGAKDSHVSSNCSMYDGTAAFFRVIGEFIEGHDKVLETIGTLFVAFFTFTLWRSTDKLGDMAQEQGEAMEKSIAESARAATAMEVIAKDIAISATAAIDSVSTVKDRTAQQMRAYICPIFGGGVYQERNRGLRFEGKVVLVNAGHTPAHELSFRTKASIAPFPLPPEFDFSIPAVAHPAAADQTKQGVLLGPQQTLTIGGAVEYFVDDTAVEEIKKGQGRALYVWGVVTYRDVFGEKRNNKFCQMVVWLPNGDMNGLFLNRHNEAD